MKNLTLFTVLAGIFAVSMAQSSDGYNSTMAAHNKSGMLGSSRTYAPGANGTGIYRPSTAQSNFLGRNGGGIQQLPHSADVMHTVKKARNNDPLIHIAKMGRAQQLKLWEWLEAQAKSSALFVLLWNGIDEVQPELETPKEVKAILP